MRTYRFLSLRARSKCIFGGLYSSKSKGIRIIYAATRKVVDQLYEDLMKAGVSVSKYHAGMSDSDRNEQQELFYEMK